MAYYPRFRDINLVQQHHCCQGPGCLGEPAHQQALDCLGRWGPVFEVQTVEFDGRLVGRQHQRFAIGECSAVLGLEEIIQPNSWAAFQGAAQFKAFAILPDETDGIDGSDSQRGKVVEDGSSSARLGADIDHVVHGQAGFKGNFLLGRIDFQVAVEAEIAKDGDAQAGVVLDDGFEARAVHQREKYQTPKPNLQAANTKLQGNIKAQAPRAACRNWF